MIRIAGNQRKVSPRWSVWFSAALLPVPQRSNRDKVTNRKLLLRKCQSAPNDLCLWRSPHTFEVDFGERFGVGICRAAISISSRVIGQGILLEIVFLLILGHSPG